MPYSQFVAWTTRILFGTSAYRSLNHSLMRILHGILADSSPMDSHRYMGTVDLQWGIFYYSLGAHGESRILRLGAPSTFSIAILA